MKMPNNKVLGIVFAEETLESVLQKVTKSFEDKNKLRIITLNPEFLVRAQKDELFEKNIHQSSLKVVDGFGLWLVLRLQGFKGRRITGNTILQALLHKASQENKTVTVVLARQGLSSKERTQEAITKKYPLMHSLRVFYLDEYQVGEHSSDFTFLATGAPSQEYLAENIVEGVAMGVGGAIDFLTGTQKRAPKILQKTGLEWTWRLVLQPSRFFRIWNAVAVFPYLALRDKK